MTVETSKTRVVERARAAAAGPRPLRIAYLVNQYPKTSHSFIRTEIDAIERAGGTVDRVTIRPTTEHLVDERDRRELERTRAILGASTGALLLALVATACTRPRRFLRALALALRCAHGMRTQPFHPFAYLVEACVLRRWLAARGCEHLHAHFGTNPAMVALLCRTLGGPPYSFTAHGIETFDNPATLAIDAKIAQARFAVAISDHGRSQLCRWSASEHWKKIVVVRCGVDPLFFATSPTPIPSTPRIICVARLGPEKGHVFLIEAAASLAASGQRFEIALVGDGPLRAELEALVRARGIEDRVRFLGWQSSQDVRREIEASRVLVLPSFAEGLPVVLMEAFALGRPVIATYVGGVPELVIPGVNGWLVPAGAPEPLAAALADALARTDAELAEMGRRGAEVVAARHDSERNARTLVELFHNGVEAGSGR